MTTIVNTPAAAPAQDSGNSMGMIVGLLFLVVIGALFFVYGLPAIQQMQRTGTPQINIPSNIDVNVKQTK